jgi:hypothetical protein
VKRSEVLGKYAWRDSITSPQPPSATSTLQKSSSESGAQSGAARSGTGPHGGTSGDDPAGLVELLKGWPVEALAEALARALTAEDRRRLAALLGDGA